MAGGPENFAAALQLARSHGLLRPLLQLVEGNDGQRQVVLGALAGALELSSKYEDAGVAFLAAGQLSDALRCYRSASAWQMVFVVAARLGKSPQDIHCLASEVAAELSSSGQLTAAASVLLHYAHDVDETVLAMIKARCALAWT